MSLLSLDNRILAAVMRWSHILFRELMRNLAILTSGMMVLSCGGEGSLDSSEVSPDSVWGRYGVESLESESKVRLLASFRLKAEDGAAIVLKSPSQIEARAQADGLFLTLSPGQDLGAFGDGYEATVPVDDSLKDVVFAWTDQNGRRTENLLKRIVTPKLEPKDIERDFEIGQTLRVGFVPARNDDQSSKETSIICQLVSMEPPVQPDASKEKQPDPYDGVVGAPKKDPETQKPDVGEMAKSASRETGCVFLAAEMENFRPGSATLQVISELSEGGVSGHKAGGERISRAFGRPVWLTLKKPNDK